MLRQVYYKVVRGERRPLYLVFFKLRGYHKRMIQYRLSDIKRMYKRFSQYGETVVPMRMPDYMILNYHQRGYKIYELDSNGTPVKAITPGEYIIKYDIKEL